MPTPRDTTVSMSPRFADEKTEAEDQLRCLRQEPGGVRVLTPAVAWLSHWAGNVGEQMPMKPNVGKGGAGKVL